MRSQHEGNTLKKVLAGMLFISVAGCSQPLTTREKGALVGAGIGAGTGALLGKGKGAAIGGAAGALGGAIVGDQMQRREGQQYNSDQQRQIEEDRAYEQQ